MLWFVALTLPACLASSPPNAPVPLLPGPSATFTLVATPTLTPTLPHPHTPAPRLPGPTAVPISPATPEPPPALSLDEKLGLLLLVGIDGAEVTRETEFLITNYRIGGVVLRGRNVRDAAQVNSLISTLRVQSLATRPLFVAIDQEGGDVARLREGLTHFPSAMALGAAGDPDLAYRVGFATATELLSVGVNVNLAPVLDTLTDPENTLIGLRAFGSDPALVAEFGLEFMRGTLDGGAIPVVKHYPGHGGTATDSHAGLPTIASLDAAPFDFAIAGGAPVVMVGHLWVQELDTRPLPASLSPNVIGALRENFDGVILTDSLNMGAVSNQYTADKAALVSFQAGADWLLVAEPSHAPLVLKKLREAVERGEISMERLEVSVRRLLALRARLTQTRAAPDFAADYALAQAVSRRALTLTCQAEPCSVKIPPTAKKILLLAPNHLPSTDAERGSNHFTYLAQLLAGRGYKVTELLYNLEEASSDVNYPLQAELYARANDVILFGAWDAHLDAALQAETLRRVQRAKKPVVVLGLHLPFDLLALRDADVYLATFGATRAQMEAVVGVLAGEFDVK